MSSSFSQRIRKDIEFKHEFKTEDYIKTEKDDTVEENHRLQNGGNFVRVENDEGNDNDEISNGDRTVSH